jgi:hypothetical protein
MPVRPEAGIGFRKARRTGRARAVAAPIEADFQTGNNLYRCAYLPCRIDVTEIIRLEGDEL